MVIVKATTGHWNAEATTTTTTKEMRWRHANDKAPPTHTQRGQEGIGKTKDPLSQQHLLVGLTGLL